MVLTPLQRGQLHVVQDELVQEPFHTRLARALQRGVSLRQGKRGSVSPGDRRGSSRSFQTDTPLPPSPDRELPTADSPSSFHRMVYQRVRQHWSVWEMGRPGAQCPSAPRPHIRGIKATAA